MDTKHPVILAQLIQREPRSWSPQQKHTDKQLLRNSAFLAAVSLCLGMYAWFTITQPQQVKTVMSHLSTNFEYDDSLGRLHLVNNMLPESAMVFLNNSTTPAEFYVPVNASVSHHWTQQEPWYEYACIGDVSACQAGEVVTIVQNQTGTHTLRILHPDGYESVYSGLNTIYSQEHDIVSSGQIIGTSSGYTAFELRRDGISVQPVFSQY